MVAFYLTMAIMVQLSRINQFKLELFTFDYRRKSFSRRRETFVFLRTPHPPPLPPYHVFLNYDLKISLLNGYVQSES